TWTWMVGPSFAGWIPSLPTIGGRAAGAWGTAGSCCSAGRRARGSRGRATATIEHDASHPVRPAEPRARGVASAPPLGPAADAPEARRRAVRRPELAV